MEPLSEWLGIAGNSILAFLFRCLKWFRLIQSRERLQRAKLVQGDRPTGGLLTVLRLTEGLDAAFIAANPDGTLARSFVSKSAISGNYDITTRIRSGTFGATAVMACHMNRLPLIGRVVNGPFVF